MGGRPRGGTGSRRPSTRPGERPREEPRLPAAGSLTSSLQDGARTHSSLLLRSRPAYGTLLWPPWRNNRIIFSSRRIVSGHCRACSSLPCLYPLNASSKHLLYVWLSVHPSIIPIDPATICPPIHPSVHPRFCLSTIYPSIHPSIYPPILLSVYPSFYVPIHVSIHPSSVFIHAFICPSINPISASILHPSTHPSIFCLSVYLSIQPSVRVSVAQSCPTLCNPMDGSPPGSSVQGILQARRLEWAAISSSRRSSRPRD